MSIRIVLAMKTSTWLKAIVVGALLFAAGCSVGTSGGGARTGGVSGGESDCQATVNSMSKCMGGRAQ